jgi:hypothetical protein
VGVVGMSWPNGQGIGLAIVWSSVRILPPRIYGGALLVWFGMPFPNRWWNTPIPIFSTAAVAGVASDLPNWQGIGSADALAARREPRPAD